MAQSSGDSDEAGELLTTTTLVAPQVLVVALILPAITTSTAGGVATTVIIVNQDSAEQVQHHLNHNREDTYEALLWGNPHSTRDLSQLFGVGVGHEEDFANLLITHREELRVLLEKEYVTIEAATTFTTHILQAMVDHKRLREDVIWQDPAAASTL